MNHEVPGLRDFILKASAAPSCKVRLAPTPSGFLHEGNAVNFVLNALPAMLHPEGRILLRIDDLDGARKRPEYIADIFDSLHWLGVPWTDGPRSPEELEHKWSQTHRLPMYEEALAACRPFIFPCQLSRKDLAGWGDQYPEEARRQMLSPDSPDVAWRANTPEGAPELPACFVIRQRNGQPAYQLTSLCDDLYFGITHIIRGADLLPSTHAQQWLAGQLGWGAFQQVQFFHHPLIKGTDGQKLSKLAGAIALKNVRERHLPIEILQTVAKWLGFGENNIGNLHDLAALFNQTAS